MDRPSVGDVRSKASLAELKSDDSLHSMKLFIILFAGRGRNYFEHKQTNKNRLSGNSGKSQFQKINFQS